MGSNGHIWARMSSYRLMWARMGIYRLMSAHMGSFGLNWAQLGSSGLMGSYGLIWGWSDDYLVIKNTSIYEVITSKENVRQKYLTNPNKSQT